MGILVATDGTEKYKDPLAKPRRRKGIQIQGVHKGIVAQWEYRLPQIALRNTKIFSQSRGDAKEYKYRVVHEGIASQLEYRLPQMGLRNTKILSQSRGDAKKYKYRVIFIVRMIMVFAVC